MPIYDLRCAKCTRVQRDVWQLAITQQEVCTCGGPVERVWLRSAPVHVFQEGFFENAAGPDGKSPYFSSRQKYKSYLKEMGMYADYVEGR